MATQTTFLSPEKLDYVNAVSSDLEDAVFDANLKSVLVRRKYHPCVN